MRKWRKVKWHTAAATCDERPAIKPPADRRPSAAFSGPSARLRRKPEIVSGFFFFLFVLFVTKIKRKKAVQARRGEEVP